jgi:4-amino-4-deoxy-L-arabinose transferase-like glycosyltransferase
MKILDVFFAVLFVLGAVVQSNDPDPYLWIPLYLLFASVPALMLAGKFNRLLLYLAMASCVLVAAVSAPGFFEYILHHTNENLMQGMSPDRMYIEETREFLGMVIVFCILGFYFFRSRKTST